MNKLWLFIKWPFVQFNKIHKADAFSGYLTYPIIFVLVFIFMIIKNAICCLF